MEKDAAKRCPCQGGTLSRFVQPMILAVLQQGPDHGYSILQKISQIGLCDQDAPDATGVYRALRDMEERGLISSCLTAESRAGLGKRVFTLTDAGRRCCESWLSTLRRYQKSVEEIIELLEYGKDL